MISHSRLTDNTAGYAGGFDEFGDGIQVRIDHSTIARNHATDPNQGAEGGGIWIVLNSLTVSNSTVADNTAKGPGGGIFTRKSNTQVIRSTVSGNRAATNSIWNLAGGGIANVANGENSSLVVKRSTIAGNRARFNGGGIENEASDGASASLVVNNSTIAGNRATDFAGGIDNFVSGSGTATASLNADTVAFNNADSDKNGTGQGGGLLRGIGAGPFSVANSLIARNTAPNGPDCSGLPFASGGHNLLTSLAGCSGFSGIGDIVNGMPRLGVLGNHDGPTQTIPLLTGSPAINRAGQGSPKRDQRGYGRFKGPDIRAFEFKGMKP